MKVGAKYQVKDGERLLIEQHPDEFQEIIDIVSSIDAEKCFKKISEEKTMTGKVLYSPKCLNRSIKSEFIQRGWKPEKVVCEYMHSYYMSDYEPRKKVSGAYREMDYVKNKVGVEVQFGKYAFMVYNVAAKMTIFHNLNIIA